MVKRGWIAGMVFLAVAFAAPAAAQAAESLVTSASPTGSFPQNKHNEPSVAIDPKNPKLVVAGSNDEIDELPCDGNNCPFVQGIGNSGVYISFDGGTSWTEPTYPGFSGRSGTLKTAANGGEIGTLPHYDAAGLVSDGDPGLAFGPVRINFSRSTDGGKTFTRPFNLSTAASQPTQDGRQGCAVATDSHGVIFVVWEDIVHKQSVFKLAKSFDGGKTFTRPKVVADVTDVGIFDGVRSFSFDGIAGARTSSFPSLAIANGAPSGKDAPNTIALGWSDA